MGSLCRRRLPLLLLFMLPAVVQAQFRYTTNFDGTITITGYTGSGGAVSIPSTIDGWPVAIIGTDAFAGSATLASVTIPDGVIAIWDGAFWNCPSLTNVTISGSVTSIKDGAFETCTNLTEVYFQGKAPNHNVSVFAGDQNVTVYYLPGTTGWSSYYAGRPTAQWFLPRPLILSSPGFGVQTNAFGFIISWATNIAVVVEGCTNLGDSVWSPLGTNALMNGWFYFSDPKWTNNATCLYRIRSP
jgi:hypothetical protein